jgi:aspartyl-tRNA(Asn)/glutamyl-tRNA(Gln) amidotransferase subunit C
MKSKKIITSKTVEHVAEVARLDLGDMEKKDLEKDLNNILVAFKSLDKAPIKTIEPTFHPLPLQNVLNRP